MPRFNFATDPEEEKRKAENRSATPSGTTPETQKHGSDDTAEGAPSGKPTEKATPAAERRLPYHETIPEEYRTQESDKYTAPPEPSRVSAAPPDSVPAEEEPVSPHDMHPSRTVPEDVQGPHEVSASDVVESPPPRAIPLATEHPTPEAAASDDDAFENPFESFDHEEFLTEPGETIPNDEPERKQSLLPLIGIAAVVLFLIAVSVIWYLNPFPPLREALEGFFYGPKQEQPGPATKDESQAEGAQVADTLEQAAPQTRDWNYYLQIAAFKELYKAQDDANRLRKLGLNAKVEGEFIPSQRRTYYRVRLGPFPSASAAAMKGDSLKDVIPATAFVDSIRVEADVVDSISNEPPMQQPILKKPSRTASSRPRSSPAPYNPERTSKTPVSAATAGFAVHIGSYRLLETAQEESRSLIGRGLPAYTSKSVQGGTSWYRVLVGPFRTKNEAERYLEIVKKESSSSAYVRSLGTGD